MIILFGSGKNEESIQNKIRKHNVKSFNFSAGPAMIFPEVLHKAQSELTNWLGQGVSVMEVSHRGKYFMELITQAEKRSARGI